MRVIVIGAGRGRRLMPTTADAPKCFAEVAGRRLLDWALDAFRANGLNRIAFIGGPDKNFDADERLRGYRDAIAARSGANEIVLRGDFTESSGYRAGLDICDGSERPDAIFAGA